jgi:hypothetical protein
MTILVQFFKIVWGKLAKFKQVCITYKVPIPRTLELLAFSEYYRFDTSAFFMRVFRALLYTQKESRSIKSGLFIES